MESSLSRWAPGQPGAFAGLGAVRHRLSTFRGLGDLLAWLFARLGVEARDACGCGRRQKLLNRWVPFRYSGKPLATAPPRPFAVEVENRTDAALSGFVQLHCGGKAALGLVTNLTPGQKREIFTDIQPSARHADRWSWSFGAARGSGSTPCAILPGRPGERVILVVEPRRIRIVHDGGACVVG